jgi:hypothetical protein
MSLLDAIRRQLLGQAAMMQPGQGMGGATQGLLGQGGQMGGGLLQSNLSQMNQGEGGLLSNIPQAALLGSALYGQGIQGRDPFSALLPAVTQTAQLQKYLTPEKEKLMTAYDPKTKKTVFATRTEIEQKGLEPVPESPELTADQRNFSAFKNIMETGNEQEKSYARQIFTKGGRDIKSKQEFLIDIANSLSKDISKSPEDIQNELPSYENIYDKIIVGIESTTISNESIPQVPKGFKGTLEQWNELKLSNRNVSDEDLIEFFNKKYGR